MSLFDSITGNLLNSVLRGNAAGDNPLATLLSFAAKGQGSLGDSFSTLLTQAGGIEGLKERGEQMGLGDVVGSWIGTGDNLTIQADQALELLGRDGVQQMAESFGVNLDQASPLIARLLPTIIDKLTPEGRINPEANAGPGLQEAVSGLLQGGGLSSLIGAFMRGGR